MENEKPLLILYRGSSNSKTIPKSSVGSCTLSVEGGRVLVSFHCTKDDTLSVEEISDIKITTEGEVTEEKKLEALREFSVHEGKAAEAVRFYLEKMQP